MQNILLLAYWLKDLMESTFYFNLIFRVMLAKSSKQPDHLVAIKIFNFKEEAGIA